MGEVTADGPGAAGRSAHGASAAAAWPAGVPDASLAERALRAALDGAAPPAPSLGGFAAQAAGALSAVERAALSGGPLAFDAAPLRRVAAMRVRVGAALASAPPAGAGADTAAIAALLAEIDGLLSDVSAIDAEVAPGGAPSLGACRSALVKAAIDFSEAAQRYVPVEVVPAPLPRPPRREPAGPGLRAPPAPAAGQVTWRPWLALAAAVLAAAAYAGWRLLAAR